ncbi:MAG: prepilin-type N-terminal cleavage/methylation domain-containing protein, partial [Candidatus Hydrogenedentales bacterium]
MRTASPQRGGARGFTLVELLVVIAIIGILAGIVVPQVAQYLRRSKIARAHAEIRNADSSLSAMLADAKRSSFRHFLDEDGLIAIGSFHDAGGTLVSYQAAQNFYNDIFYALLRQGKNIRTSDPDIASVLNEEVLDKLGTGYMDLGLDPWSHQYNFWMCPQPRGLMQHRSYRGL